MVFYHDCKKCKHCVQFKKHLWFCSLAQSFIPEKKIEQHCYAWRGIRNDNLDVDDAVEHGE